VVNATVPDAFAPTQLGPVQLRNRLIKAATSATEPGEFENRIDRRFEGTRVALDLSKE
jgi:hypothetical protein